MSDDVASGLLDPARNDERNGREVEDGVVTNRRVCFTTHYCIYALRTPMCAIPTVPSFLPRLFMKGLPAARGCGMDDDRTLRRRTGIKGDDGHRPYTEC